MPSQRIVVIGGSAGSVDALLGIADGLPADFPAPIFVTIHMPAEVPSVLPELVMRRGRLRAKHAEDGERYERGVIYVAPPDRHLLIERGETLRVVRGPRENRHRPAIDPLFRSAAAIAGSDTIALILSGALDDGTAGSIAVKNRGGIVLVQDPREAMHASMPESVIEHVKVDHILSLREVPKKLVELTRAEDSRPRLSGQRRAAVLNSQSAEMMEMENRITEFDPDVFQNDVRPGAPSAFSCPDCGGVLWEINDGGYARFRCRVGHAFSPEAMLSGQSDVLEEALWSALKTLEESARISKRLAERERQLGHTWIAARFKQREADARERADTIRKVLVSASREVPQEAPEELETSGR